MFNPEHIKATKFVVSTLTKLGTGKIVYSIVSNQVPILTTFDKVKVGFGTFMLAGAVATPVSAYSEEFIDDCVEMIEQGKEQYDKFQANKS